MLILRVAWAIGWRLALGVGFLSVAEALFPAGNLTSHVLIAFALWVICTQGLAVALKAHEESRGQKSAWEQRRETMLAPQSPLPVPESPAAWSLERDAEAARDAMRAAAAAREAKAHKD